MRTSPIPAWQPRGLVAWLCVLLLVFAQHAALAHGISHLGAGASGDDPTLPFHDKVCEQCHQASQVGAGLPPARIVVDVALPHLAPLEVSGSVFESPSAPPFSSRAPPRFSRQDA